MFNVAVKEHKLVSVLDHLNVVKMYGIYQDSDNDEIRILMEYGGSTTLCDYVKTKGKLSELESLSFIK